MASKKTKGPTKKHLGDDARDFHAIDRDARDIHRRVVALNERDKHVGRAGGRADDFDDVRSDDSIPPELRVRIAKALGWSVKETYQFGLTTLIAWVDAGGRDPEAVRALREVTERGVHFFGKPESLASIRKQERRRGFAGGSKAGSKAPSSGSELSDADKLKCFTTSMKKAIATLEEKLRQKSAAFTFHDVDYSQGASLAAVRHGPLRSVNVSFFIMGPRGMRVSYYGSFRYDREDFLEGTLYVQGHGQTKVDFTRAKCAEIAKVIASTSSIPRPDWRIGTGS